MKNFLWAILCIIFFTDCKKDKNGPITDYREMFKKSVWRGEIKYEGKLSNKPYSMIIDIDGTFEWWEGGPKRYGVYTIDNTKKEMVLTYTSGASVIARIQNESILSDFTNAGSYPWTIVNAEINAQAATFTEQALTGSVWNAKHANGQPFCRLTFKPNSIVNFQPAGGIFNSDRPYSLRGGAIEFNSLATDKSFGVINKEGIIMGIIQTYSSNPNLYPWQATRQ